ncbi:MAG: NAD+ synthase [Endomicrobiales bacterium]|nr:NAD+ synthase [Endomicrobiales bacterium]
MKINTKIIKWIKMKVKNSGAKGCVFGLSGGIDSAVVSVLASKAVGRKKVLALIMPCESSKKDIDDALLMAKKFKLPYKTINLKPFYKLIRKTLPKGNKLAIANLKPRLRMLVLYYFANNLNYLVVGTGNKSELSVGYFTKYGDGGVDILPLGNIFKKDVVKLAQKLSVPENIINKPPSAGLWSGQTDESEMGITYNQLDKILADIENKNLTKNSSAKKVKKMMKLSSHKLRLPPIFSH